MSEFPSHWDFKRIGDFASRVLRKNSGGECQDPMTISAVDGLVSQRDYFNKIVASKNTESYTLLRKNDFAYNKSYSDGYPVGAARRLKTKDRGIVSPLYICFELDGKQIDLQFADYLFDSDWFVQAIFGIAKEGARSHGLLNIGIDEFFSALLPIPPLPEQKKIAEILSANARLINAIKNKITLLGKLVTATRNDLFAKHERNGDLLKVSISDLMKSGDLILVQDGNHGERHPKSSQFTNSGVPFIMASHIRDGQFLPDPNKCLSQEIISSLRIGHSRPCDVLLTHKATIGETCIVPSTYQEIMLSPQVTMYRLHNESTLTPELLREWFMTTAFQSEISENSGQSTRDYIGIKAQQGLHAMLPKEKDISNKITSTILPISKTIHSLSNELLIQVKLQYALNADLLSGRKRVSV